jgi:hypothetical protein
LESLPVTERWYFLFVEQDGSPEVSSFSLAAVFIDVTLTRFFLVPAAMQVLGHWACALSRISS